MFKKQTTKINEGINSIIQDNIVFITGAILLIELAWISLSDTRNHILSNFMRLTGGDINTIGLLFIVLGLAYLFIVLILSRFKFGKWLMKTLTVALFWVSLYQLVVLLATRG